MLRPHQFRHINRQDLVRKGISNLLNSNNPRIRGITHLPVRRRILGIRDLIRLRSYHPVSATMPRTFICVKLKELWPHFSVNLTVTPGVLLRFCRSAGQATFQTEFFQRA